MVVSLLRVGLGTSAESGGSVLVELSGFLQIEGIISFAANDFLALLFDISLISLKQR